MCGWQKQQFLLFSGSKHDVLRKFLQLGGDTSVTKSQANEKQYLSREMKKADVSVALFFTPAVRRQAQSHSQTKCWKLTGWVRAETKLISVHGDHNMLNIPQCHLAKDKRAEVMFLYVVKVTVILSLLNLQVINRNYPPQKILFLHLEADLITFTWCCCWNIVPQLEPGRC